jgi:hypothetical protein
MKNLAIILAVFALTFVISPSAIAQTSKTDVFQLGSQATRIPPPPDFEEAASQFENIKKLMTTTESPLNDMLAVHMPHADCERIRTGWLGPFNFYTKVSVMKEARNQDYSAGSFANLVSSFHKSLPQALDIDSPEMKAIAKRLDKGLSDFSKQEVQVDLSQPINLGEFEVGPDVYSFVLLINLTTRNGESENPSPVLGGVSLVRIKQRVVFVYTYRKYESAADVEVLRDFTKKWIGQILAAN